MTISYTASAAPGSPHSTSAAPPPPARRLATWSTRSSILPGPPVVTAPADGAPNQPTPPAFQWSAAIQGSVYRLAMATDSAFAGLVLAMTLEDHELHRRDRPREQHRVLLARWVVQLLRRWYLVCRLDVRHVAVPGDCGLGSLPVIEFFDDFETGAPGWTHNSVTGPDTWELDSGITGSHSGSYVYHVDDYDSYSDQRLVSPSVTLPAEGVTPSPSSSGTTSPSRTAGSECWDGAIVEISTDGGNNWTYLPAVHMLTDPYDGPVYGLSDLDGWCGDPQNWLRSVVDLNAYAGETVRFRFRMGTDGSVGVPDGHLGWDIDDVTVQSCGEGVISLPLHGRLRVG